MAGFMSLPYELRVIIYQYTWEKPLSALNCVEVVEQELIQNRHPSWTRPAISYFPIQQGSVSRNYGFYPVDTLVRDVHRLTLINRRCHLEVTGLLYKHLTFGVVLGIANAWKDWVQPHEVGGGYYIGRGPRNGPNSCLNPSEAINADLLARITSLKLTVRDIVDRPDKRLRLQTNLEAFILRLNQTPHNLKRLVVIFEGIRFSNYLPLSAKNQQQYQYLLEPLVALRVSDVRIEGVSEDFAMKMAAVMTGQHTGEMQEIDCHGDTDPVYHWPERLRKRKAAEGEMEVRPPQKRVCPPK